MFKKGTGPSSRATCTTVVRYHSTEHTLETGFLDPARDAGLAEAAREAGFALFDAGFTDALEAGLADALEAGFATALEAGLVEAGLALEAGLAYRRCKNANIG